MATPPQKIDMRFNSAPCNIDDVYDALAKIAKWAQKFAPEQLFAREVYYPDGRPLLVNNKLFIQELVVDGLEALGRVRLAIDDQLEYMAFKFLDHHFANQFDNGDLVVEVDVQHDTPTGRLKLFIPPTHIAGYDVDSVGSWPLEYDFAGPQFVLRDPEDKFKVKVNDEDDEDFLEDQFNGYTEDAPAAADPLLKVYTKDVAGDKLLEIYLDLSAITGYSASGIRLLGTEDGVLKFFEPDTSSCPPPV